MIFRKWGRIPHNVNFTYKDIRLEIFSKFKYLGIIFTPDPSYNANGQMLAGQALK